MTNNAITPPREGHESIAGTPWLARMLDKARLKHEGTIDHFDLVYPCPMDQRLLEQLQVSSDTFQQIAIDNTTDNAVVDALKEAGAKLA